MINPTVTVDTRRLPLLPGIPADEDDRGIYTAEITMLNTNKDNFRCRLIHPETGDIKAKNVDLPDYVIVDTQIVVEVE